VLGVQVFYARWGDDGRLMNEIKLENHGLLNDNLVIACQIVDFIDGEFLSGIGFGFT
jgi:hypothetical protein